MPEKARPDKAVALFEQAAAAGHKDAMYFLGVCYLENAGVDEDFKQRQQLAISW